MRGIKPVEHAQQDYETLLNLANEMRNALSAACHPVVGMHTSEVLMKQQAVLSRCHDAIKAYDDWRCP